MLVGNLPVNVGVIGKQFDEMLFWQYCPIKAPGGNVKIPETLKQFYDIILAVKTHDPGEYYNSYVYLTAKTLWVSGDYIGNRPGWHIDGFGTDDINYVWADRAPTEFIAGEWHISDDCDISLQEMEELGGNNTIFTYPDQSLLRLDNTVIHRSPVGFEPGMRTFVKVSLSKNIYNLKGNSVNHLLDLDIRYEERQATRNHPHVKAIS